MNYHLIIQEKFFNAYIEDIYRIHKEENNVIWVRGNKTDSCFFSTDHPVEYLGNDRNHILKCLRSLNEEDKLFISWYDLFIGEIVLDSGIKNSVYVYLLGAEFYSQPFWWHASWLFDRITKRRVIKERLLPQFLPLRTPWRWYRCFNYFKFKKSVRTEYNRKLETIKRIDYIVITEHSGPEVELVRRLYPGCTACHAIGCFDQNYDIAKSLPMKPIPQASDSLSILFGNSSDPNGNHLDAFPYLYKLYGRKHHIHSFLSYGDEDAKEWALDCGKKLFGDNFHPILEYMSRDEFVVFVNSMDVVVMYHNRQQAEGNIMTALVLGKPVFMKPSNPQYDMLRRMGIKPVYDVSLIGRIDLRQAIIDAQASRDETIKAIADEYSEAARLLNLRQLLA